MFGKYNLVKKAKKISVSGPIVFVAWCRIHDTDHRKSPWNSYSSNSMADLVISDRDGDGNSQLWGPMGMKLYFGVHKIECEPNDPTMGIVAWQVPENVEIVVTLFRDPRRCEFETKEWTFAIESADVGESVNKGNKKVLATYCIDLKSYATIVPSQFSCELDFQPVSTIFKRVTLNFTLSCVFLRRGKATDDDMQSLASLMSLQQGDTNDIANLDDVANLADFPDVDQFKEEQQNEKVSEEIQQLASRFCMFSTTNEKISDITEAPKDGTPRSNVETIAEIPFSNNNTGTNNLPPSMPCGDDNTGINHKTSFESLNANTSHQSVSVPSVTKHTDVSPKKAHREAAVQAMRSEANFKVIENKPHMDLPLKVDEGDHRAAHESKVSPASELLDWCVRVTKDYRGVKVVNWTTSFRSGLAFCAIIHRHRPDLIDFDSLVPHHIRENNSLAFEAAESFGVPRILDAADMVFLTVPDKLNIMTYVYHLRAQLTGSSTCQPVRPTLSNQQQQQQRIAVSPPASVPESDDWLSPLCKLSPNEKVAMNTGNARDDRRFRKSKSPEEVCSVQSSTNSSLTRPKGNSGKTERLVDGGKASPVPPADLALRSQPEQSIQSSRAPPLMTRKQLLNPFDSDSDNDDSKSNCAVVSSPQADNPPLAVASLKTANKQGDQQTSNQSAVNRSPSTPTTDTKVPEKQSSLDSSCSSDRTSPVGLESPSLVNCDSSKACVSDASTPDRKPSGRSRGQRNEELRDRARMLLEQARCDAMANSPPSNQENLKSTKNSVSQEDARKQELRERARRLIAESRANALSHSSGAELIMVNADGVRGKSSGENRSRRLNQLKLHKLPTNGQNQDYSIRQTEVQTGSQMRVMDCNPLGAGGTSNLASDPAVRMLQPGGLASPSGDYVQSEIDSLERCLRRLDERATAVEWSLRHAMKAAGDGQVDETHEARLTSEWFALVDERNELVHRVEQLNVVAHEQDLERRFAMLSVELQRLMSSDRQSGADEDFEDDDRSRREQLLLAELVSIVNQRDELVQQLDAQPRSDDPEVSATRQAPPEVEANKNRSGVAVNNSCVLQ